jgi:hypothetical protein
MVMNDDGSTRRKDDQMPEDGEGEYAASDDFDRALKGFIVGSSHDYAFHSHLGSHGHLFRVFSMARPRRSFKSIPVDHGIRFWLPPCSVMASSVDSAAFTICRLSFLEAGRNSEV